MSDESVVVLPWTSLEFQPVEIRELPGSDRDALTVSAIQVEGHWVTLSRYGEDIWQLDGFASNVPEGLKHQDFRRVPIAFKAVMKALIYRYLQRGRAGQKRPKASSVRNLFQNALPFLRYLDALNLDRLGVVTPMICANYVAECRAYRQTHRSRGKPLSQSALERRFMAVEAIYELSQYTHDRIPLPPWPDTSASALAGGRMSSKLGGKTPLMPDEVFCALFESAYEKVQHGKALLDLRDALDAVAVAR